MTSARLASIDATVYEVKIVLICASLAKGIKNGVSEMIVWSNLSDLVDTKTIV